MPYIREQSPWLAAGETAGNMGAIYAQALQQRAAMKLRQDEFTQQMALQGQQMGREDQRFQWQKERAGVQDAQWDKTFMMQQAVNDSVAARNNAIAATKTGNNTLVNSALLEQILKKNPEQVAKLMPFADDWARSAGEKFITQQRSDETSLPEVSALQTFRGGLIPEFQKQIPPVDDGTGKLVESKAPISISPEFDQQLLELTSQGAMSPEGLLQLRSLLQPTLRPNVTSEISTPSKLAWLGAGPNITPAQTNSWSIVPRALPQAQKSPAVGSVVKGYKFKGGNPAAKNNWEKVAQ